MCGNKKCWILLNWKENQQRKLQLSSSWSPKQKLNILCSGRWLRLSSFITCPEQLWIRSPLDVEYVVTKIFRYFQIFQCRKTEELVWICWPGAQQVGHGMAVHAPCSKKTAGNVCAFEILFLFWGQMPCRPASNVQTSTDWTLSRFHMVTWKYSVTRSRCLKARTAVLWSHRFSEKCKG